MQRVASVQVEAFLEAAAPSETLRVPEAVVYNSSKKKACDMVGPLDGELYIYIYIFIYLYSDKI